MAAPSMVSRDGENTLVKSVDAVFGLSEGEDNDSGGEGGGGSQEENGGQEQDISQLPQCKIKRNYSCTLCDYYTQNPRFYLYHQKQVHKEKIKIFECPNCLYASKHSQKLQRHIHMVHVMGKKRISKAKVRLIKQKAARMRRMPPTPPPPPPPPIDVDPEAPHSPMQEDDEEAEGQPEPMFAPDGTPIFKCSVCDMTSKSQMLVARHERVVHLKKKFFRCAKCNYMTHMKARYTKHVKYHSMPMIKCEMCDFKTPYKWNLDRHNKNHQGDGAFKCVMCNFAADIKQSLTVHEMNHHVPPVGHMAIIGGRRRLRVGASDTLGQESMNMLGLDEDPMDQDELNLSYDPDGGEDNMEPQNPADFLQTQLDEIPTQPTPPPSALKFSMSRVLVPLGKIPTPSRKAHGFIQIQKYKCKVCDYSGNLGEVQRHEGSVHGLNDLQANLNMSKKNIARPIPNLIPIQGQSLLKPPSERGDLSNSSFNDLAPPQDDNKPMSSAGSKSTSPTPSDDRRFHETFKRKNASFFDKLKEKLMTNASDRDLTCGICGFESKCLSEHMKHQKLHSDGEEDAPAANNSFQGELSSTRCQHCRQRCKTSTDLVLHLQTCSALTPSQDAPFPLIKKEPIEIDDSPTKKAEGEKVHEGLSHPMENKVFVWNNFGNSEESKNSRGFEMNFYQRPEDREPLHNFQNTMVNGTPPAPPPPPPRYESHMPVQYHPPRETTRKVFKCPNCSFWASTASRFHVHIVGHLNKRPFQCSLCHYSSNWRWDITKHIRLKQMRDSAHEKARVLLTDEAGRRNYSKYNKYLITISAEEFKKAQQPRKSLPKENGEASPAKSPNKKSDSKDEEEDDDQPSNKKSSCPENKKTMWKCKKCLFRNSDRGVVLAHVKEHYRSMNEKKGLTRHQDQEDGDRSHENGDYQSETENNPKVECPEFMCETCPYVCDTLAQLEEHAERHFVTQGANIKCQFCPFYADDSEQLMEHLDLHEPPDASDDTNKSVVFACLECPYVGTNHEQLVYHRQWHEKSLPHKCFKCNYSAHNNIILSLHVRLHGRGFDTGGFDVSLPRKSEPVYSADISGVNTSSFSDIPMVWVSKPMGISKMFKCRYCPHVNMRKTNIQEHEKMHSSRPQSGHEDNQIQHHCPDCNYICNNAGVLSSHMKVHQAFYGQVCGIVDHKRTDEEQIEEMKKKVAEYEESNKRKNGEEESNEGTNDDQGTNGLALHFCNVCPARFLYLKEIVIHLRFHTLNLPFKCESCSYTARQKHHLLAHLKVHTDEYQERTSALCKLYPTDKNYPKQKVVVVLGTPSETGWNWKSDSIWVVVKNEVEEPVENEKENEEKGDKEIRKKKKPLSCEKCPAEFFKEVAMQYHRKLHGGSGPHKCRYCDYAVKTYGNLVKHEMVHREFSSLRKKTGFEAEPYKLKPDSLKSSPQKSPQSDPEFGSLIFGSPEFIYPTYVKNGKLREKKYKCHKCPSAFDKRDQYKIHLSLHGARQRYKCEKCDYSVKYFANYAQHMKKHNISETAKKQHNKEFIIEDRDDEIPESPIVERSGKSIRISVQDKQTMMLMQTRNTGNGLLRENEVISRCPYCPYANNRKDGVSSHIKCHSNTKGGAYTCKYCDYNVPQLHFLREHLKVHFSNIKFVKPDVYMKCDKLELWSEPVDANHNSGRKLVFKDSGTGKGDRYLPPVEKPDDFENMKGRIYINLKTGEEEIEMDDEEEEEGGEEMKEEEEPQVNGEAKMDVDEEEQEDEEEEEEQQQGFADDAGDENYCESSASSDESSESSESLSASVTNTSQQD